jgi:hypothetical protein
MSPSTYLEALGLTEAVEVPMACLGLVALARAGILEAAALDVAVNLASYPVFVFVLVPLLARALAPDPAVWVAELAVWWLEAAAILLWLRREPLVVILVTLVANGCSFLLGLAVF